MKDSPSESALSPLQDMPAPEQKNAPHRLRESACRLDPRAFTMQVQILIASKIEAIDPAVTRLMRLLRRTCCPSEREFAVETALREALANAIVHGNHGNPSKKVRVCCGCDAAQGVQIVVRDEGEGFDPTELPSPVAEENLASDHGRGIFLINALMDEVHFEEGGREIHMRKSGSTSH